MKILPQPVIWTGIVLTAIVAYSIHFLGGLLRAAGHGLEFLGDAALALHEDEAGA